MISHQGERALCNGPGNGPMGIATDNAQIGWRWLIAYPLFESQDAFIRTGYFIRCQPPMANRAKKAGKNQFLVGRVGR